MHSYRHSCSWGECSWMDCQLVFWKHWYGLHSLQVARLTEMSQHRFDVCQQNRFWSRGFTVWALWGSGSTLKFLGSLKISIWARKGYCWSFSPGCRTTFCGSGQGDARDIQIGSLWGCNDQQTGALAKQGLLTAQYPLILGTTLREKCQGLHHTHFPSPLVQSVGILWKYAGALQCCLDHNMSNVRKDYLSYYWKVIPCLQLATEVAVHRVAAVMAMILMVVVHRNRVGLLFDW